VTDSETEVRYDSANKPGVSNLIEIYSACTGKGIKDVETEFSGQGYGILKQHVGEAVVETLRPIRDEALRVLADKAFLENICKLGAERASRPANKTLSKVYKKIGFIQM